MTERLQRLWSSRPARSLRRDRWALVCLCVVLCYMLIAVVVKLGALGLAFEDRVGDKYLWPSTDDWKLWLGTDRLGRSILARTLYSAKLAIGVGFVCALVGSILGALLGGVAGYFGGRTDDFIVWLYSTVQSIPYLLLLMLITYVARGLELSGLGGIYIAFCATFWVGPCRVVRGEVIRLREAEYVEAARAIGFGEWRILLRHVLPNTLHIVFVYFALLFVGAIKSEVILSFLGLGVQGEPSWGIMISHSKAELINGFYWQIGAATAAMFGLVLCFNVLSDALQDAFDPKSN